MERRSVGVLVVFTVRNLIIWLSALLVTFVLRRVELFSSSVRMLRVDLERLMITLRPR